MDTPRRVMLVVVALAGVCARLSAHDVIVEQVVGMTVEARAGRLVARLQIPSSLLNEAGLPTLDDGRVAPTASESALQAVADDVSRNLDFRQGENPLRVTAASARLGPDARSIEVEISYALTGPPLALSGRLNAFHGAPLQPPRTDITYERPGTAPRHLTVTGPATRVAFDPGVVDVVQQFFIRALDAVLSVGSHLLFLIAMLLPLRRARDSARIFAALVAAQVPGIVAGAMASPLQLSLPAVDMIAWSAVVMVSLFAITASGFQAFISIAVVIGFLSGSAFGATFAGARQLAGAHGAIALAAFTVAILAAESWLASVIGATRIWLASVVPADRVLTVLAAAAVAHSAVHRVLEWGAEVGAAGSFVAAHAVTLLALAWTSVMVVVALSRFARGVRPVDDSERWREATS